MNLLVTFIILNILNVIMQTVKSICTVKCGKGVAALVNAIAYGLYTIVTIYMMCELSLYLKAGVVALCNLIGVYIVKFIEEKSRKDKLWKVEMTVKKEDTEELADFFSLVKIPYNYIENVGKYTIFNIYCSTQKQSLVAKKLGKQFNAKFFVSETKTL